MKLRAAMRISLLSLSLLLTACFGSNGSQPPVSLGRVLTEVLSGQAPSVDMTPEEREQIRTAYQASLPPFPVPSLAAVEKLEQLNDPEVNDWITKLMVLCRQLSYTCGE